MTEDAPSLSIFFVFFIDEKNAAEDENIDCDVFTETSSGICTGAKRGRSGAAKSAEGTFVLSVCVGVGIVDGVCTEDCVSVFGRD